MEKKKKKQRARQDTMPDDGSLRQQGVVAGKDMIHFLQGDEKLSYQEKLDSLCVGMWAE